MGDVISVRRERGFSVPTVAVLSLLMAGLEYFFIVQFSGAGLPAWIVSAALLGLFVAMQKSGNVARYRRIFFVGSSLLFVPAFIAGLLETRGSMALGAKDVFLNETPFCHIVIPQVILSGRRINDSMGVFVAKEVVKCTLAQGHVSFNGNRPMATILGFTFKENVRDLRNTRVIDIVKALNSYSFDVQIHDPLAYPEEAQHEYGIKLTRFEELKPAHAVILAVAHDEYKMNPWELVTGLLKSRQGVVADVRNVLPRAQTPRGVTLWRL